MDNISIFDIFKIGVGPSSSHTLGPWKAANQYIEEMPTGDIDSIFVHLYGSLSKTGIGHGTDIACILGLMGFDPKTIDTSLIDTYIDNLKNTKILRIANQEVHFDTDKHIVFESQFLPYHPNGLKFECFYTNGEYFTSTYYSVGGGFIEKEGEDKNSKDSDVTLPYPMDTGAQLLSYCQQENVNIYDIVLANEKAWNDEQTIHDKVLEIWDTMKDSIYRGCHTSGILPGGLDVKRRSYELNHLMLNAALPYNTIEQWMERISLQQQDFVSINKWISCFALAVNEENASFGRIVTSPTNGAAGVIPAVFMYYSVFVRSMTADSLMRFFLTAGVIGGLFKKKATISAAVGGCQAEIGVSSAMAAGGLTALLGGSPEHILNAAEIAMEHHLGLTCDPVAGLVQIPCIERNTMGAMKAITAAHLSMSTDPSASRINFDVVVKTMWETAQDMNHKYKETAEGGLAANISVAQPSC